MADKNIGHGSTTTFHMPRQQKTTALVLHTGTRERRPVLRDRADGFNACYTQSLLSTALPRTSSLRYTHHVPTTQLVTLGSTTLPSMVPVSIKKPQNYVQNKRTHTHTLTRKNNTAAVAVGTKNI